MSPDLNIEGAACQPSGKAGEEYFAFPATLGQIAMLPADLSGGVDSRFNGAFRMKLTGELNVEVLERSLREIVHRHESLRTGFRRNGDAVQQLISSESALALGVVDLRCLSDDQRSAELDEVSREEAQRGFDLTTGNPIRAKVVQLQESESVLLLTIHQSVCDGWSIGLLIEELTAIYTAFIQGHSSPLPPLDFQFGDYAVWQSENAQRPEVQAQLDYWRTKLEECPQPKVAPDFERTIASSSGEIVSVLLPRELTDKIRALGQQNNTTFVVVAMTACIALLHRYTGSDDLAMRTPLAGRGMVEFEGIIGQFVNQVLIRAKVPDSSSFLDLLKIVQGSMLEALTNQDIPFETVLQEIFKTKIAEQGELFGVNFVCQKEYGRGGSFQHRLGEVEMTTMPSKSQGALYDLNFFLVEREVGWRLSLEYKTDFYSRETAESLLLHFQEIFRFAVDSPEREFSDMPLSETAALLEREKKNVSQYSEIGNPIEGHEELHALPASFAQERFWALSQVDPSNPTFNMPVRVRLSGKLSVPELEASFKLLIERHEILRTTFFEVDGELRQIVHNSFDFSLSTTSLESATATDAASQLDAIVRSEVERPFELDKLPLFRALLCRLGPEEHILVITVHHILADAWSIQVLQKDLWEAYEGLRANDKFTLSPLELQYADFSVWQREDSNHEETTRHLGFWLRKLSGDLPVLKFPTDKVHRSELQAVGACETQLLPDDVGRSLKQFAQSRETTLFVVSLAGFAALLARTTGAEDLIVGSPVLNRRIETEPLIGPFAGPMALRLDASGDPTLRSFVDRVRDATLEALGHSELPFEQLLDRLRVRPVDGRSPLFQFYFFCQPAFLKSRELPDLSILPLPSIGLGTPFEMQMAVIEREEGIRAELEFNTDLFQAATIRKWLEYYQSILTALVHTPEIRLSDLPYPAHINVEAITSGAVGAENAASIERSRESAQRRSAVGGQEPVSVPQAPVHDAITTEVARIWEAALNREEVGLQDDFFELGGRSLIAARLIAKINAKFGLKLGLATLFAYPTIERLAQLIRGQLVTDTGTSVVAIQTRGSLPPLFVIHGVGGNVLNFYDLSQRLGADQPVYGVEAQALQSGSRPLTTLEDLAAYYVQQVRKQQRTGPYYFLGYSYGGFVAFEMARQLQMANERVELVGMLDTPVWRHGLREDSGTVSKIIRQLMAVWTPFFNRLRPCTPTEIFDGIKSTILRSMYTVMVDRKIEIPSFLRSVYHINSFAAVNYIPKLYRGKVTMLRAAGEKGPKDLGWGRFTTVPSEVYEIPGAHLQILSKKNLPLVVESLKKCLSGVNRQM